MCGIVAVIYSTGNRYDRRKLNDAVNKIVARGPEATCVKEYAGSFFGFTRLAINGLTDAGMQPYQKGNLSWICNGEIYNSKELEKSLGIEHAGSDCECIGDLYMRHRDDLATFARALDGVFALVLYDGDLNKLIVARDPYGIRPLYIGFRPEVTPSFDSHYKYNVATYVFASELKADRKSNV